jgi:hypothetical protein
MPILATLLLLLGGWEITSLNPTGKVTAAAPKDAVAVVVSTPRNLP